MRMIYENFSDKVFGGFYDSNLYNSDMLYSYEYDKTPEGFEWDFKENDFKNFCKETCMDYVDAIRDNFSENPIGLEVGKYRGMWSPREYNFYTDRIQFYVKFNLNKLKKWCFESVADKFDDYLYKNWTSCDGFWSFIPNSLRAFVNAYKHGYNLCTKDDLIQVMVEFYLLENVDFANVEYDVCENVWERISDNVILRKSDDWTQWDFEYGDNGYIVTRKVA